MNRKTTLFFFIAILILVSVKSESFQDARKELLNPYNIPTASPINVITSKVEHIITPTPLQGYQGLFEILNVTNRGNIIEAYLMPDDHSYITGGLLSTGIYKLDKLRFYVNNKNPKGHSGNTIDDLGGPLEPTVIYRSAEYPTLEEALKHPGAVVQLSFCVVPGKLFQSKFSPFQATLGKIKEPGSSAPLLGKFVYMWFDHILQFKEYYAYTGSYTDIDNGKQYPGTINLIASPQIIGFSFPQLKAFQQVKGNDGKPIEAIATIYEQGNRPVFHAVDVKQVLHLI